MDWSGALSTEYICMAWFGIISLLETSNIRDDYMNPIWCLQTQIAKSKNQPVWFVLGPRVIWMGALEHIHEKHSLAKGHVHGSWSPLFIALSGWLVACNPSWLAGLIIIIIIWWRACYLSTTVALEVKRPAIIGRNFRGTFVFSLPRNTWTSSESNDILRFISTKSGRSQPKVNDLNQQHVINPIFCKQIIICHSKELSNNNDTTIQWTRGSQLSNLNPICVSEIEWDCQSSEKAL